MKLEIYAIYDKKAEYFGTPFTMPNQAMAERIFIDQVNDKSMTIGKNPQDFSLFHLGNMDQVSGKITGGKAYPKEIRHGLSEQ